MNKQEKPQPLNSFDKFVYKMSDFTKELDKKMNELTQDEKSFFDEDVKKNLISKWITNPTPTQELQANFEVVSKFMYDTSLFGFAHKWVKKWVSKLENNPYYKKFMKSKGTNKPIN